MRDVREFIAAERQRLNDEFEPGFGTKVSHGRMLDEQAWLLDRLERWITPRPFDRQRIYAAGADPVHRFDSDAPDRTLCGRVQDPEVVLRYSAMLGIMSTCAACDEEYERMCRAEWEHKEPPEIDRRRLRGGARRPTRAC